SSKALAVNGQGDLQQASRGSSVLTDNFRWQAYLAGMTNDESEKLAHYDGQPIAEDRGYYVRFCISKQNYGSPFTEKWFRRGKGGILEPLSLSTATKPLETIGSRKESRNGNLGHD